MRTSLMAITRTLTLALLLPTPHAIAFAADQRQAAASNAAIPPSSYADIADFAADAAVIIDARIRKTRLVEPERAPGLRPGMARFYVEAQVNAVLLGREAVARRFAYLLDVSLGENGRPTRVPKERVLLFARPVTQANQLVLVTPASQLTWTAGRDATARAIAAELAASPAPPRVTGIAQAYHVRGTVTGESESQIFLGTATGSPVSLSILRRPGQAPRWVAAFGEIVDESTSAPARRTLGWYRLACGLPPRIPPAVLASAEPADADAMVRDYALVTTGLGPCDRTVPTTTAVRPSPSGGG